MNIPNLWLCHLATDSAVGRNVCDSALGTTADQMRFVSSNRANLRTDIAYKGSHRIEDDVLDYPDEHQR